MSMFQSAPFPANSSHATRRLKERRLTIPCDLQFNHVIEMLAMRQMRSDEIIKAVAEHIGRQGSFSTEWFSGIRRKARVHPWDEAELSFPTSRWIALQADSPIEARNAVEQLVELGLTKTHGSEAPADAAQVFAYALNSH
jgi:hypothetical protein